MNKHERQIAVIAAFDRGLTTKQIAQEAGIGGRQVLRILEVEKARRAAAETSIDPKSLSMSAQQKLESAMRQHQRALDIKFEQRVQTECKRRIEQTILPQYNAERELYHAVIKGRKGAMSKATYKLILSRLHPDWKGDRTAAFAAFAGLEKVLLDERGSPTDLKPLPQTLDELMKNARQPRANRRARSVARG